MKLFHWIFGLFRSHGGPNQIALAVALGAVLGIMPLWESSSLLWLGLFLVFRISPGALLASMTIFKIIDKSGSLQTVAYQLGESLLSQTSPTIVDSWKSFCSWPIISLLQFDRYYMLGSFLLGLATAIVVYLAFRLLYKLKWIIKIVKFIAGAKPFHAVFLFLLGDKPVKGNSFIRGKLLIAVAVVLALIITALTIWGGTLIHNKAESWGSYTLGAPVTLKSATLNLWQGQLLLQGVTVGDPANPQRVLFSANLITIGIAPRGFLHGQLVLDKVVMDDATLRLGRTQDGSLNFTQVKPLARHNDLLKQGVPTDWPGLPQNANLGRLFSGQPLDWVEQGRKWLIDQEVIQHYRHKQRHKLIDEYWQKFQGAADVKEALSHLSNLPGIEDIEQLLGFTPDEIKLKVGRPEYLKQPKVRVICEELQAKNLAVEFFLADQKAESMACTITLRHLSSNPAAYEPITGSITCQDIRITALTPIYHASSPLLFDKGQLKGELAFQYVAQQNALSGNGKVEIKDIQAMKNSTVPLLDVSADAFLQSVNHNGLWEFPFTITGTLSQISLDTPELSKQIRLPIPNITKDAVKDEAKDAKKLVPTNDNGSIFDLQKPDDKK